MANYKGVKGYKVQSHASDPTVNEGQLWYNTTSSTLKYDTIGAGSWSAGNDMVTGREGGGTGFGTQTAGVAVGGGPAPTTGKKVEEYNGTAWTEVTNMPRGGIQGGTFGSETAGVAVCFPSTETMSYNGSTWTELAAHNTSRDAGNGAGILTAGLYIGGVTSINLTELYNGSVWTVNPTLNQGRGQAIAGGTSTAAVFAGGGGGSPPTNPTQTETFNGTSWSEVAELNSGRAYLTGGGDTNDSIVFGGGPMPGVTTKTEKWNGTSWTEVGAMANASETAFGTCPGAGQLTYRGGTPGSGAVTEEWDNSPAVVKTVTVT